MNPGTATIAITVIVVTLIFDFVILTMTQPPRIKQRWIILWHVPFFLALVFIGWHLPIPQFAVPVRIVQ
jgi:hypothetical protein